MLTAFLNMVLNLPLYPWRFLVVFGLCFIAALLIYFVITRLAVEERVRTFKAISPGVLPPLGIIFGLLLVFTGSPIWINYDKAKQTLYNEAGALRGILIAARGLPADQEKEYRLLVDKHIAQTISVEWPMLIEGESYGTQSPDLIEAFDYSYSLNPQDEIQKVLVKDILSKWETVREGRRERIFISQGKIHPIKIAGLLVIMVCFYIALGFVHADNRKTCALALSLFATTFGMSMFFLAAYARPFSGLHAVLSQEILTVVPESVPCRCKT